MNKLYGCVVDMQDHLVPKNGMTLFYLIYLLYRCLLVTVNSFYQTVFKKRNLFSGCLLIFISFRWRLWFWRFPTASRSIYLKLCHWSIQICFFFLLKLAFIFTGYQLHFWWLNLVDELIIWTCKNNTILTLNYKFFFSFSILLLIFSLIAIFS